MEEIDMVTPNKGLQPRRVSWFNRKPTVTTPVIDWMENVMPNQTLQQTRAGSVNLGR